MMSRELIDSRMENHDCSCDANLDMRKAACLEVLVSGGEPKEL